MPTSHEGVFDLKHIPKDLVRVFFVAEQKDKPQTNSIQIIDLLPEHSLGKRLPKPEKGDLQSSYKLRNLVASVMASKLQLDTVKHYSLYRTDHQQKI